MVQHFELFDLYKAFFAIVAGLILGFEREMKDKSAGLKTITVICLGSTLFSILSYKVAGNGDPARIASYIVSGIGFLGAGVIFRQGFNVRGLTTAGIIWIAAAIGMAIGFGQIYLAFVFLLTALFVIYSAQFITTNFLPQNHNRTLTIHLHGEHSLEEKNDIIRELRKMARELNEVAMQKEEQAMLCTMDIDIDLKNISQFENYLCTNPKIVSFTYQ